jgi:outer membrane lipoprotein-sorting protein
LVSGSHTLRVWYAGPDRVRLALLGSLGESDVVRTGTDLWTWSSADKSATHRTVPLATRGSDAGHTGTGTSMTPQQLADQALGAITPTTKVSTDGTAQVAGRSAYELVLQPRTSATLVDSVHIAIDGATHIPLRVQVFARGATKPALEVGFTSFDPTAPPASVFAFNPPPGTKVTQGSGTSATPGATGKSPEAKTAEPTISGTGWSSVVVTKLPGGTLGKGNPLAGMVDRLPVVHGAWGSGHVLRGTLFSAVLTDDGRLAVGAVAPEALYAALAG